MFGPLLFPALRAPEPVLLPLPARAATGPTARSPASDEVERLLEAHPGEVAAVVVEPLVQGAAGMIVHPEGYLRGLRELSRRHGMLLIADEVAVGFGRTGTLFACEQEGVTPDFLCLAKGLTGGYLPLAATLTTEEVYSAFFGDRRRGEDLLSRPHLRREPARRGRRPWRALQVFDDERTLDGSPRRSPGWPSDWPSSRALPHVGDVRQCGLIAGHRAGGRQGDEGPVSTRDEQVGARVCRRARDFGLLIRPLGDVLVVMPPLAIACRTTRRDARRDD